MPREYELWLAIEAYGAQAVLGRIIGAGEARRMAAVRNVIMAYKSRDAYRDENGASNWAEWARRHPDMAQVLAMAEKVADDGE